MTLPLPLLMRRRSGGDAYAVSGVRPPLVADFENEVYRTGGNATTFDDMFTFTRASDATYVDSSGTIQTAASGEPRIGNHVYNGTSWVNEGLLIESEARTNALTYSEDFTNAGWTKTNAVVALDETGPDGVANSAVTLTDSSAGGANQVRLLEGVTVSTSTAYTFSVFMKQGQLNWAYLRGLGFTSGDGVTYFNLATGAVGQTDANHTATIEDFGGGWYRCSITFTTDATDTSGSVIIGIAVGDGANVASTPLDGTSSILIYGAQFEEGSTPSSYIPTSGSTVTRSAETLTIAAADLPLRCHRHAQRRDADDCCG